MSTLSDQALRPGVRYAEPDTVAEEGVVVASTTTPVAGRSRGRRVARTTLSGLSTAVVVLLVTSFLTFLLGYFAKQKPAEILLGETATREEVRQLNHQLGLDRPLLVRYFRWLGDAIHGDLGTSWFTKIPVRQSIAERFPVSLSIAVFALLIALVLGGTFGILAAVRQGGLIDRVVTIVSAGIATLPPFVVAIALIVVFGVVWPIFPTGGYVEPSTSVPQWIVHMTLPAVALGLDAAADIARQLRTGLVGTLGENYVIGARLRGLSPTRILFVHALRNGSGPAVATLAIQVPRLIGGAVIAEAIFALPGLGQFARDGASRGDVPVVIGALMVTVLIVLAASLVVNVLLTTLRPEARR